MSFDKAKYTAVATALKVADRMPSVYRMLGNTLGSFRRTRSSGPANLDSRAKRILDWCDQYNIVQDGDKVAELGTGWTHTESMILRSVYKLNATLFDVWDNRQLNALQANVRGLGDTIKSVVGEESDRAAQVEQVVNAVTSADSFEAIYDALGFEYVVDESGLLKTFSPGYQFVYSYNVMEHVKAPIAKELVRDIHRVLLPGGYTSHEIDMSDHLVSFVRANLPKKYYLRFGEKAWRNLYQNDVQYINRIQCSEWIDLFTESGFEIVEVERYSSELAGLKVADRYDRFDQEDLSCFRVRILARKL